MLTPIPAPPLQFDYKHVRGLYERGEYDALSEELLRGLRYFHTAVFIEEPSIANVVTPFVKQFLFLFTQPDYVISDKHIPAFLVSNTLISHLTAMTPFKNTDAFLDILRNQPSNFIKILTLFSARNTVQFDRNLLFEASPLHTSIWYNQYCCIYKTGLLRDDILARMTEHLWHQDEHMLPVVGIAEPYFSSSYVDGALDSKIKPFINAMAKRHLAPFPPCNPPTGGPVKIGVFSDLWYKEHSVYRNYAAYVKDLRPHYHLTLFYFTSDRAKLDTAMFDEVEKLDMQNGRVPMEQLMNRFHVFYLPDIGMTETSILLANLRIAPLQLCSPGHSVSTWGGEIDYFISGADVEVKKNPERNYSERLVLLPGMGAIHNQPLYTLSGASKPAAAKANGEVIVNCPWSGHKTHASYLRTIRKIIDQAKVPVRWRLFPNTGVSLDNAHYPYLQDIRAALGPDAILEVNPALPYNEYMRAMEEGDLMLDSFHFAGCNCVADSLFLHKPTLVWEGDKWYNRIGPAMLRLVGLDEWICANEEEYIEKALTLIHNSKKREKIQAKLRNTDLNATLFSVKHAPAFRRALDYLLANHEKLKNQKVKSAISIR